MAKDHIEMKLKTGKVIIKLRPDLAPNHVKRISELVEQSFYDGLAFQCIGFMGLTLEILVSH